VENIDKDFQLSLNMEDLLFGAIAMNLIGVLYAIVIIGLIVMGVVDIMLVKNNLDRLYIFIGDVIVICAVYPFFKFCMWGANGFLQKQFWPMVTVGIFFAVYGMSGILSFHPDGFVAAGVTVLTLGVVIWGHWNEIVNKRLPFQEASVS
jgi:hypothetical protein